MSSKLILGDCIEILKSIQSNSIDHIICDLPYFNVLKTDWDQQWNTLEEYLNWINLVLIEYKRIIKSNGNILLFTSRQNQHKIANILDLYFIEQRVIIWKRKRGFNNTRGKTLASGYEPISWYSATENFTFNNIKQSVDSDRKEYKDGILKDGITMSDVLDIPALPHNHKEKVDHPSQKPLKLMEVLISQFTKEEDIVLDSCMGSGSTGVACKSLNRNFIGIEKNKEYFNIAKSRIEE